MWRRRRSGALVGALHLEYPSQRGRKKRPRGLLRETQRRLRGTQRQALQVSVRSPYRTCLPVWHVLQACLPWRRAILEGQRLERMANGIGLADQMSSTQPRIEEKLARPGRGGIGLLAKLWNPRRETVRWYTDHPHGSRLCGIIVDESRYRWESADDQSLGRAARDLNVGGDVTRWKGATSGSADIIGRC